MLKNVIVIAFVALGCAGQPSSEVCKSGIICPSGTKCAAAQAVCITNNCGDGIVDVGEACDDGNIIDGDGCAHDCKKEGCGNGTVDPGEDCDPPGSTTTSGIPCSASCKFEVCGNGVIDGDTHPGEQCDDGSGNTDSPCVTPAYANPPATCSTCTTSCTVRVVEGPYCGDHICQTALGETITSCAGDCAGCGNGVIDTGEECDSGPNNTDTPCATPAYHNPPLTCSTCSTSCTINTVIGPYCGDGTCNNGETFTSCPADCIGCGNGLIEGTEQCDNGPMNTDTPCATPNYHNPPLTCSTCTTSCTTDTVVGPFCGDGTCANGETKNSCPADCVGCGNGKIEGTEQCDNGAANTNIPCATPPYSNPPGACSTCSTSCVLNTVVGPYCGDGACNNGETRTTCPADCTGCGNGIIETGEQCDDGAANTNTPCATPSYHNPPHICSTCTTSCMVNTVIGPYCGNGTCDTGETAAGCPADCAGCGNGTLESGEQCDNGGANTNTPCATPGYHNPPNTCSTCTTSCTINTVVGPFCGDGTCGSGETKTTCPTDCTGCGNGLIETGEQCDDGAANTNTPCATPAYNNPPATCSTCTKSCTLNVVVGPYCGDGACNSGETSSTCPDDCTGCGNGIVESGEECDDGAFNTNTPCSTPGYHNPPNTCSTCTTSCTLNTVLGPYCGDGIQNGTEQCDGTDGTKCPGTKTGAICTSGCVLDTSHCM
jgi:cysteine-rich repeat protein